MKHLKISLCLPIVYVKSIEIRNCNTHLLQTIKSYCDQILDAITQDGMHNIFPISLHLSLSNTVANLYRLTINLAPSRFILNLFLIIFILSLSKHFHTLSQSINHSRPNVRFPFIRGRINKQLKPYTSKLPSTHGRY